MGPANAMRRSHSLESADSSRCVGQSCVQEAGSVARNERASADVSGVSVGRWGPSPSLSGASVPRSAEAIQGS